MRVTKHPSRKVMNFRHLLGCDTILRCFNNLEKISGTFDPFRNNRLEKSRKKTEETENFRPC